MKRGRLSWWWGWDRGVSIAINGYEGQFITQWSLSFAVWDLCLGFSVSLQKPGTSQALRDAAGGGRDG